MEKNSTRSGNWFIKSLNIIIYLAVFITIMILFNYLPFLSLTNNDQETSTYFLYSFIGNQEFTTSRLVILSIFIVYCVSIGLYIFKWFLFKDPKRKLGMILHFLSLGLLLISSFIIFLSTPIISLIEGYKMEYQSMTLPLNIVFICLSSVLMLIEFSDIFGYKKYSIQEIAETSILIALAVVLDKYAKIPIQANGGSISFSAVPLFIIGMRYGGFKCFIASSLIFGLISCLVDGYGIQTFPFDYFVALSGYGFVGYFFGLAKKQYEKSTKKNGKRQFVYYLFALLVAGFPVMITRYVGHMISGAILYQPITFLDNFIYQSTYVPASVWVSIGASIFLLEPILLINRVFPVKTLKNV